MKQTTSQTLIYLCEVQTVVEPVAGVCRLLADLLYLAAAWTLTI